MGTSSAIAQGPPAGAPPEQVQVCNGARRAGTDRRPLHPPSRG